MKKVFYYDEETNKNIEYMDAANPFIPQKYTKVKIDDELYMVTDVVYEPGDPVERFYITLK